MSIDEEPGALARSAFPRWPVQVAAALTMTIGTVMLGAWLSGAAARWSAGGGIIMKANLALALVLAGLALVLEERGRTRLPLRIVVVTLSVFLLVLGALTGSEHLFRCDLGIDQLLATEFPGAVATASPNRMGPPASVTLVLLGAGLLALALGRRRVAPYLGLSACLINLLPTVGYLYEIDAFYEKAQLTGIAWPSVVGLMSLGLGLMLAHPEGGPLALLRRHDAGGALLRRLVPAAVLIPLGLGFLHVMGERRGVFGMAMGTGMLVLTLILLFTFLLWRSAARLSLSDRDQQRATQALRDQKEWLQVTLYSIGDAVITTDAGGSVLQMNPVAEALTGCSEVAARGRLLSEVFKIVNEKTRAVVESPVTRVIREGVVVGLANHTLLIANDGTERPIADSGAPIRDGDGGIGGVVLVFRDQTAERSEEAALREAEERFRAFFDNAPIGKSMTSPDGRLLRVNTAFGSMLGYSLEEMEHIFFASITHPDDVAESRECVRALLAGERDTWLMEKRYVAKDGHLVWTSVSTRLQRDPVGKPLYFLTHVQDITERKCAELAAQEARDRLEEAQRVARVGSWEWDAVQDKITGSQEFFRLFDVEPALLAEFSQFVERLHPDDRARVQQDVADALKQNRPYDTDYRLMLRDGGWRDINARGRLFSDEHGKTVGMVGTCADITERKRAETTLRDERDRIKTILDFVGDPIFVKDNDHRITLANRAFYEIFRLDEASVLGHTLAEAVPENEKQHFLAVDRKVFDTGVPDMREEELTVGDLTRTVVTRKKRFINASGQRFLVGSIHDITERKRAEMEVRVLNAALEQRVAERTTELRQSKELLDQTGRLARVGGWEIDLERNEVTWTDVVYQIHEVEPGYRPTVEGGINFYAPEAVPVISEAVRRVIEEAQPFDVELPLITAKKNRIWVRALGEATRKDGKVTLVRGVFQDIHARKLAELELQTYREHLEESNKELEAFSYSVSHDLRAPLRAIAGFARILSDEYGPKLDDEARRVCAIIDENTSRMGRLIDDLLAFSRLGRTEMQPSEIDMGGMARAVYYEVTTPEHRARIDLQLDMMPTVVGDPSLMRQVWTNLLSNAVKFSSKRERVVIAIRGEINDGEKVFSVRDNGAGFDMHYVGKLFGVFQRLHSTREFEGTGVGLALVQRVIRRHGGRVWAEGEPDRGATFSFALPQKGT